MLRVSRRRFLQAGAATGTGLLLSGGLTYAANEKVAVAVVGIAGQGAYNLNQTHAAGGQVVALCDVHESRKEVADAREKFSTAKFYTDYRKLLDTEKLDAIVIATPDHTHAVISMASLKKNLHVYCEKPLAHTVQEARVVADTAFFAKRVTQMGTQIHAGNNYRRVVEIIQAGVLGEIREVHVWCGKAWGGGDRPSEKPEIPAGLHYDLWLGPAPERPYHSAYIPFHWRKWWDFGGGTLADMACHHMDLPFWALKLRHPTKIVSDSPKPHPETAPLAQTVTYEFPARDGLPPVTLKWYDGDRRPSYFEKKGMLPTWGDGSLFVGSKGMLLADYGKYKLLPENRFKDFTPPTPTIPNSIGHHKEWIEACKTGGPTTCDFQYSGALSEAVLLGNVAHRLGKPITWDAEKLQAVGEPEADRFIRKEYRNGWKL
jgi:predicted dehydrogenase